MAGVRGARGMLAMLVAMLVPPPGSSSAGARRCGIPPGAWVALSPRGAPGVSTETPVVGVGGRLLVAAPTR